VVLITSGVNEKTGGATDRNDPQGRLRLLDKNAAIYRDGIVSARIAEIVLRDERAAIPIGSYQCEFGVTLSLPSVVGHAGVLEVMQPELSPAERGALEKSAEGLRTALQRVGN
jgi:L-lactate dehydrogenase